MDRQYGKIGTIFCVYANGTKYNGYIWDVIHHPYPVHPGPLQ